MTDRETTRLIAWSSELRRIHARLREAVALARAAAAGADESSAAADLSLYCRGFCAALDEHHRGEDRALFPAIEAAHPELAGTLRKLTQDHSMIDFLITRLTQATRANATAYEIEGHLEGIAAIMESHFAYEERQLVAVLDSLALEADPRDVLGRL